MDPDSSFSDSDSAMPDSHEASRWKRLWGLLALLFLLDLAVRLLTFSAGPDSLVLDAREYWEVGGQVADGDFLLTQKQVPYRTPFYIWLLGFFRAVLGSHALLATVVLQHACVSLTSLLTGWICMRLSRGALAFPIGYGLSTCCVSRAWFANVLLTESIFTLFLTLMIAAGLEYHRSPAATRSAAWGFLLGLCVLIRPTPQLLAVPLLATMFLRSFGRSRSVPFRHATRHAIIMLFAIAVTLFPWYAHNRIIFGEWFLAKLPAVNKWAVCFQGGSTAHLPIPQSQHGKRLLQLLDSPDGDLRDRYCYSVVRRLRAAGLSDSEIDDLVSAVCRDAILENPGRFGYSAFKRTVNFWRCVINPYPFYVRDQPLRYDGQVVWRWSRTAGVWESVLRHTPARSLWWCQLTSLLAGVGLALLLWRGETRSAGCVLALTFLYFAAVTGVVAIENYRYRMVLEPGMIAAAVCGGWNLASRFSRSSDPAGVPTPTPAMFQGPES